MPGSTRVIEEMVFRGNRTVTAVHTSDVEGHQAEQYKKYDWLANQENIGVHPLRLNGVTH